MRSIPARTIEAIVPAGITAPFWFAFVGSAALVAILWRQFDHIAHSNTD